MYQVKKIIRAQKAYNAYAIVIILTIVLIFSGCGSAKNNKKNNAEVWNLKELEARHYDIPFTFDAQPILEQNSSSSVITFKSNLSLKQAIDFYRQQMDMCGWNLLFCVSEAETLLSFEKPNKYATISMRPSISNPNQIMIVISLAMKECIT